MLKKYAAFVGKPAPARKCAEAAAFHFESNDEKANGRIIKPSFIFDLIKKSKPGQVPVILFRFHLDKQAF
jgi:hypothetical protein